MNVTHTSRASRTSHFTCIVHANEATTVSKRSLPELKRNEIVSLWRIDPIVMQKLTFKDVNMATAKILSLVALYEYLLVSSLFRSKLCSSNHALSFPYCFPLLVPRSLVNETKGENFAHKSSGNEITGPQIKAFFTEKLAASFTSFVVSLTLRKGESFS